MLLLLANPTWISTAAVGDIYSTGLRLIWSQCKLQQVEPSTLLLVHCKGHGDVATAAPAQGSNSHPASGFCSDVAAAPRQAALVAHAGSQQSPDSQQSLLLLDCCGAQKLVELLASAPAPLLCSDLEAP